MTAAQTADYSPWAIHPTTTASDCDFRPISPAFTTGFPKAHRPQCLRLAPDSPRIRCTDRIRFNVHDTYPPVVPTSYNLIFQVGLEILNHPNLLVSFVLEHFLTHIHCLRMQRRCGDTCPFLGLTEMSGFILAPEEFVYRYKYTVPDSTPASGVPHSQ